MRFRSFAGASSLHQWHREWVVALLGSVFGVLQSPAPFQGQGLTCASGGLRMTDCVTENKWLIRLMA